MFQVDVKDGVILDNTIRVDKNKDYFQKLNQELWFKFALESIQNYDVFNAIDSSGNILYDAAYNDK